MFKFKSMMEKHRWSKFSGIMLFMSAILFTSSQSVASDLSGIPSAQQSNQSQQQEKQSQLDPGHRYIQGTVEGVSDDTIKVNAGEVGDMSPRYLDIEKTPAGEPVNVGDTLRVEVNLENKVVSYQKITSDKQNATGQPDSMSAQPKSSR
ncbi:MAG: hypothetical protein R3B74_03795 [Nitrospirales bacterium]|nr:hypothetical protein [Nitrospirales bacterium]